MSKAPQAPLLLSLLFPLVALLPSARAGGADDVHTKQCMDAETVQQCQLALPTCKKLEAARRKEPVSRQRDLALARLLNKLLECEDELDEFVAAEQHGRSALTLRQKHLGPDHAEIAESLNNLGLVLNRQGTFGEAEKLHRQALAMRQKLLGLEHRDIAESLGNLSQALERQGRFGEAEAYCRQALAMERRFLGPGHRSTTESLQSLANILL